MAAAAVALVAVGVSVPATIMGHRKAHGVRVVKTVVTALLLLAGVLALSARGVAGWGAAGASGASGAGDGAPWPAILLVVGLAFTVVADWLLGPVDNSRTFAAGLAAFLVGYLLYGVALGAPTVAATSPYLAAGAATFAAVVGVRQYRSLTGVPDGLRPAVIAYVAVASLLLAAGVLQALPSLWGVVPSIGAVATSGAARVLVAVGALSIYLSDSLIGQNLFRAPLRNEQLWIMPTYYVGQIAVVAALILG